MKFSISFKYSNVTFKNKETKETVTYDSKAEGNTFTFDNVDEDVVIGMVKGIKDRKASQVFAYDNFRTNFINVIARNKCKELYDKLDKGDWKVEDIAISTITLKDLEFTKPTMNARETLTVESRIKKCNESKETVEVEFKKTPEDDGSSVIAFFPQTMHDGSCNPGNIMSYEHNGQHGEASIDYYNDCTNCFEEDYASLLHELEGIYDDCELVVVEK